MKPLLTLMILFSLQLAAVPQIVHIGNGSEPKDLDPQFNTGNPEYHILMNLLEPLVDKDPKTLKTIPGVAERWTISKNGKTYIFFLRKNAKWSNGDSVTAQDFIYTWLRLLKPNTEAEYVSFGFYIKNGKGFHTGEVKDPSLVGLRAIDNFTLEVALENPTPFFLKLLCSQPMLPVHKSTVEKFGPKWTRPENFVGNGAFVLHKWLLNKVIVLKKNSLYWDEKKVQLQEIHLHATGKPDTEEKMFRAGELHGISEVPIERIPYWEADKSGAFIKHPYLGVYYYSFNINKPPLNNPLVRKALTYGFDRELLTSKVTLAKQLPATFFTPPGTGGYTAPSKLPKDGSGVKKAKEFLKEAGYPDGKNLPPIELLYNTNDNIKKIAEAMQQMWKENLGITVTLLNQEWKVMQDNQRLKNFTMLRGGWTADYNDPTTFLELFTSQSTNNHTGWSNPEYDKLILRAASELNSKKRNSLFTKAEEILLDELPVLPIYIYTRLTLVNPKLKGWYPNLEDYHPLKGVSLSD